MKLIPNPLLHRARAQTIGRFNDQGSIMAVISFAGLELRFLLDKHSTQGGVDLFTTTAKPRLDMPSSRRALKKVCSTIS